MTSFLTSTSALTLALHDEHECSHSIRDIVTNTLVHESPDDVFHDEYECSHSLRDIVTNTLVRESPDVVFHDEYECSHSLFALTRKHELRQTSP